MMRKIVIIFFYIHFTFQTLLNFQFQPFTEMIWGFIVNTEFLFSSFFFHHKFTEIITISTTKFVDFNLKCDEEKWLRPRTAIFFIWNEKKRKKNEYLNWRVQMKKKKKKFKLRYIQNWEEMISRQTHVKEN